jgi:hypothetical protein
MNRREIAVWAVAICIVLSVFSTIFLDRRDAQPQPFQPRQKGVMEKKYESLRNEMTRNEVEAILGKSTSRTLRGGSLSTCEQFCYVWRGEDGLIAICFSKYPEDKYAPYGPPGMGCRIKTKFWQPSSF